VEARLEAGEPGEALLAFAAGAQIDIAETELSAARRRAMLVLAAGGDPHRELELDAPAVEMLARDLDTPERREALRRGFSELRKSVAGLPLTSALLSGLEDDLELGWRAFALALLADELGRD
jgi:hypothetical protein